MSTPLPELPAMPHTHIMLLSDLQSGTEPGFNRWHMEQYARAYGLAVWKAAIEGAAKHLEWLATLTSGPYESDGHYAMLHDSANAVRSLPLPESDMTQARTEK